MFKSMNEFSQQQYFDMLPLSKEQRENIIKDFIETDQYDKVEEKDNPWLDANKENTTPVLSHNDFSDNDEIKKCSHEQEEVSSSCEQLEMLKLLRT